MDYLCTYSSPLGEITLASDGTHLIGLWFEGGRYAGETISKDAVKRDDLPVFQETKHWLNLYFVGKDPNFRPPLLVRGSVFRKNVCQKILAIPYGQTKTYGDLAKEVAAERGLAHMSAQAVGGAVSHNPISLIIPCHRVVGTNGSLTGYGGGIWRKVKLLELEKVNLKNFFIPKKGTAL